MPRELSKKVEIPRDSLRQRNLIRLILVASWLVLTLSLSAWWMANGLRSSALISGAALAARQHRMFFWEGTFLLSFILVGGAFLFYAIYRDQQRNEDVRRFFSTFTHELKTSLTSLRLQAEILEEDPRNRENENLRRLLRDVARLELQLENALVLAQSERGKLFPEEISLRKMLDSLRPHWPDLEIKLEQDASLVADQRALECVFRNLFQNALVHGHASSVLIRLKAMESGVLVQVIDNGKGFEGNLETLGAAFVRHTTRSGSGIGLYLSRILTTRMGGKISFSRNELRGLCVSIELKGWLE